MEVVGDENSFEITLIKDLRPEPSPLNLVGLVICKHSPRQLKDPKSNEQNGGSRYVMSFTIRDVSGHINCSLWGNEPFVMNVCQSFQIGDFVTLSNGQTTMKGPSDEIFNPSNSSAFNITISEKYGGNILPCDVLPELKQLLHAPIRPNNDYYTLEELIEQGERMNGEYVNILAVVRKISSVQHLKTKNGKDLDKMEVSFFDNTSDTFTVVVWEREYFSYIQQWTEKRSVIFAADVRLNQNKFKNCLQGTFTSKTVCIRDPDTGNAHQLYDYALEYADRMEELFGNSKDDLGNDIQNLDDDELQTFTVEEILAAQKEMTSQHTEEPHKPNAKRGFLQAAITSFNIDDSKNIWCLRCSSCRYRISSDGSKWCPNEQCVTRQDTSKFSVERTFDLQMSLSDHTGTLDQCRIGGKAAENLFGITVDGLECLTTEDLTDLKWSWLMERCRVRFRFSFDHPASRPRIERCEKPSLEQALNGIRV
uniref:meiosis-specific with OB domain-containing protein-like n=1 Tax=Styela clava TaxID=7725 RepID=UPI00193AD18A|nr:meiosis-specific with OB domain-containing protein-like [Styela clava]